MANPITWRNVDGLDTSGVSNLMSLANQTMNKGFETATSTVKDAITQRASDLKVSRDATLNTALANLNKLSTAEFNDNNIVGSIAVDAGINDPASRRAYEEQVNALRKARREEDEAIALEAHKQNQRPIEIEQAQANVKNTGSQTAQNYASANNLNASAASTQQQTSARRWEQGQRESQLNFEQNNAGVLGQLSNANPEYFTQDNLDSLTKGMSPADARFLYKNWTALRDASITRGGSQPTAQTALLNAQEQLGTTKDAQAGRAVVNDAFRNGASYDNAAGVVALMPNGPAKNAALAALNEVYAGNQVGSNEYGKLVKAEGVTAATTMGTNLAASAKTPEEAEAAIVKLYQPGTDEYNAARLGYAGAVNNNADATNKVTESATANAGANAKETVRKFMSDPANLLALTSLANSPNPAEGARRLANAVPIAEQPAVIAAIEQSIDAQATNIAKQFVESNADTILQAMRDPAKNPYEVLNSSLNEIKNPAVRAQARNSLLEQMKASGDNGIAVAAVVEGKAKEVESALATQVNKLKPDITGLAINRLNGKITDEEFKSSIAGLAQGDPAMQERLTTEAGKIEGQFNTLSPREQQTLERESAAIQRDYDSKIEAASTEAKYTKNSHPVDNAVAPITDSNQVQQNLANKLSKVKETYGETLNNFESSQVAGKINETFNDAGFKKGLSEDLNAFSKRVSDAVAAGQIPEATGKRIVNTLYNDPAVLNAIHNQIINTVVQPDANGVIEFTTYGYRYGGNIQQVENARPAAVIAVGMNVLNQEIQRVTDANLLKQTSAYQTEKDTAIVELGKRFKGNPQSPKK